MTPEALAAALERALPDLEPEKARRLATRIAFHVEFFQGRMEPANPNKAGEAGRQVARDARKLAETLVTPVGKQRFAVKEHLIMPAQGHEDREPLDVDALLIGLGRLERRAEALAGLCSYPSKRVSNPNKDEFVEGIAGAYAEITARDAGFSIDPSGDVGGPFARVLAVAAAAAGLDNSIKALRERFLRLKAAEK